MRRLSDYNWHHQGALSMVVRNMACPVLWADSEEHSKNANTPKRVFGHRPGIKAAAAHSTNAVILSRVVVGHLLLLWPDNDKR
jgi:hypothetical protein